MLSQFLHGEQGALFAAAQVTEAVQFFDGKLYGATQVMDEARHVEVFHRYLDRSSEALPDQRQPLRDHRRAHERRALGHEVPRHADHGRGARARRLRHDLPR
jgi:hypothetical protein